MALSNLATGDAPVKIYPRTDQVATPSEETKTQGWIYFYAPPGDYDLEVTTYQSASESSYITPLSKHFVLHVRQDVKIIYGGSLGSKCHDTKYGLLVNCDVVDAIHDETEAAKLITQEFFADSKPFVTELLQPLAINRTLADLQPIGLVIQQQGELFTPPWVRRGMSRFTGIGDPGKAYNPPSPNFSGGGCGQACAGILMLYLMYLPVGALIGAGYGEYTEAKWQPCISSLQQELAHYDFPTKLGDAIIQTFPKTFSPAPLNLSHSLNQMEEASLHGLKTILKADIQRIQLRECAKDGTFCMEFAMHFTVNDIKSGQVLFGKTMIYSESEASIQDRPYEVRTQKSPSCYVMNAYCGNDKIVFQSQIKEAMDILAHEMLNTLRDKNDKTEKDN
ncbi:hypothetical protein IVG45_08760 [Methylomonas sp. LL1]|uniref:hypothetical protein n=1 Tax=Methylomonas sp. LL1 TaxID=2785785 RepID=UPI0018C3D711|nr:hypothetical protein [Methylomonas sp. LL1]QPK65009.1 hypothetical protein IVG45_08760 [Methylomonas sp. LL1]